MAKIAYAVPDQRAFWDRWHEEHTHASHSDHSDEALQTFIHALPKPHGSRVLEVGCGQGREAVRLAQRGLKVSAFDYSPVAMLAAKNNAALAGVHLDLTEHDTSQPLPYRSSVFQGVFAHLSLHYFDDIGTRGLFAEVGRVLVQRGILFFTVRSLHDPLYGKGDKIGDHIYCYEGHLRHFFEKSYVEEVLSDWDIRMAEYYDTNNRSVNPGVFIRVLAIRP